MSTVMKELYTPSAPSYTLHRFPEKQPGVFLGMCEQPSVLSASSVCLISLALSLTPTFLAQLTEALSKHKHLSLEWQRKLVYLPHLITLPTFPCLSIVSLGATPFLNHASLSPIHPPSLPISSQVSAFFVYFSHASVTVFSGWLLTPPC